MNEVKDNIIVTKSYSFALEIIIVYKKLLSEKKNMYYLNKFCEVELRLEQIFMKPSASESKKDFIHKLGISLKEARETSYWLNLKDSEYITQLEFDKLNKTC
jgi:hypothetical protein